MSNSKRKRILLASNIFPPEIGGPASFIADLAKELTLMGYEAAVVCLSKTPTHSSDAERPYRVYRIAPVKLRLSKLWKYVNTLWVYANLMRRVAQHDIVFCNTLEHYIRPVCRLLHRSYILKIVGDIAWEIARNTGQTRLSIDDFQSSPLSGYISRIAQERSQSAREAKIVITPSEYLRKAVIGWGCEPARVIKIPNGVCLSDFSNREPTYRTRGPLRLIFVGRLVSWKGVDHLLDALDGIAGVELVIVGDGPEMGALQAKSKLLNVAVTFLGGLPRQVTLQKVAKSHILVLPSSYEGLSHTLIEACASGVPCITSERGGNPEVIEDGVNGLIVPYGDVARLHEAIVHLRDNEPERLRLATAAKHRSRDFDFQTTLEDTIQVLLNP